MVDYVALTETSIPKIKTLTRRYRSEMREDLEQDAVERVWRKRRDWNPNRAPWTAFVVVQSRKAIYQTLRATRRPQEFEAEEVNTAPYAAAEARRMLMELAARASLTPRERRAVEEYLRTGEWTCRVAGSRAVHALREVACD